MSISRNCLPLTILFVCHTSALFAQLEFRQIALTGSQAPGTKDQSLFGSQFLWPQINNAGEVAFGASLVTGFGAPVGPDNHFAIFGPVSGDGPELGVVARYGDVAPGTADGAVYADYSLSIDLNDSGDVAFVAALRRGEGIAVPPNQAEALFGPVAGAGSALGLLARADDPAGTADNAEFSRFGSPTLNSSGEVAFSTTLRTRVGGDPVTTANDRAGVLTNNEGLLWMWREGEPALGTNGAVLGDPTGMSFNDHGDVAFSSFLESGGMEAVTDDNRNALYGPTDGPNSDLGLILREGDAAPNVSDAAVIDDILLPQLSNTGQVAFLARLRSEGGELLPDTGAALFGPGETEADEPVLVMRGGDPAPGTIDDAVFAGSPYTMRLAINSNNDLALLTNLTTGDGPEVTPETRRALYTHVIGTGLDLVVRSGDEFQVTLPDGATTETRTISNIHFLDGGFNDNGAVVFGLQFTDATQGVFTAQTTAVPEPSSLVIFLGLGVAAMCKRRFSQRL